jgi:hypothetical protein
MRTPNSDLFYLETRIKNIENPQDVDMGALKPQVASDYQYPSFIIPKKNGTVRIVSDFRVLNSKLQSVVFHISKKRIYLPV